MPHDTPLIATIVVGIVLAFIFGALAHRIRLPPLVGYLFAGILVGPHTPGFVADTGLAPQLAEIGVILLMFGVGLHFSLKDLLSVRAIAVPGALAQIAAATALGYVFSRFLGWSVGAGLVFGLALSVASTVVLLKSLQERRIVETERGRIAVGWLIVEDIAMVLALVLIPAIASLADDKPGLDDPLVAAVASAFQIDLGVGAIIGLTILKVAAFVGFMLVVGRRVIPWVLHHTAHTGSRELFRLSVLAIALGVAFGAAKLFGVSLALGAFFAGMILSESELSHRAAQETLPLRDAFSVLFFVSVGMLFDPHILLNDPIEVFVTVFIIVIGKSLAAFLIVLAFRRGVSTALTISASLAQIGEFSFILADLGVGLKIMPEEARDLVLAGALMSIVLNPLVFWFADRANRRYDRKAAPAPAVLVETVEAAILPPPPPPSAKANEPADDLPAPTVKTGHTVVIGYGRVGGDIGEALKGTGPCVVIEQSDKGCEAARRDGHEAFSGNAADGNILALANPQAARCVMVAIPDAFEAGNVVEQARKANPAALVVARAHSDAEVEHLAKLGADAVILGEREIARAMVARAAAAALPTMPGPA